MRRFFKGAALFLVIACFVWVAVLWRWQATARDMSTRDIVVYLGLLPVAVFVFALLARWAWRGAGERAAARSAAAAASASSASASPAAAAQGVDEAERHATVQVLAAFIVSAAGTSPSELLSAARDGSPRPGLDAELRDDDGLPVLAARVADADSQTVGDESEALLAALRTAHPEWADREVPETLWRALSLLREPLAKAVDALLPWADQLIAGAGAGAGKGSAAGAKAEAGSERSVRVLLGWPVGWSDFEQELARTVVADRLILQTANALPGVRFAISAQAVGGEELLLQADRLMQTLARAKHDDPLIVAACHSTIGDDAVGELEAQGLLFHTKRRPKGRMPAEAAAAIVLAGPQWPIAPDADAPPTHLHRPALLRRDKSIDAPGRVGPQTASEAIRSALGAGRLDAAAVAGLVGDADQHTERAAEFFQAAAEALPDLDASDDVCAIGHVTGAVGNVGALLVVACVAELARSAEKPCVALTVSDGHARLALVALPAAPTAAAAATEASAAAVS